MNERIRELALEAFQPINDIASEGVADRYTFDQAWFQLYNEKFAQLIVRECISIADEYDGVGSTIVGRIEKHFGVEE